MKNSHYSPILTSDELIISDAPDKQAKEVGLWSTRRPEPLSCASCYFLYSLHSFLITKFLKDPFPTMAEFPVVVLINSTIFEFEYCSLFGKKLSISYFGRKFILLSRAKNEKTNFSHFWINEACFDLCPVWSIGWWKLGINIPQGQQYIWVYAQRMLNHTIGHLLMFIAALFIIVRTWTQPRFPSTEEWIKKMWCIYTIEYYSVVKKNDILKFVYKWMELKKTILSEAAQIQKDSTVCTH